MKSILTKTHKFTDKKRIVVSVAISTVIMLLCTAFLVPQAINNDDLIIHSITAGVYGESSPGLVHTNILMGKALVFLQNTFGSVNWFELTEFILIYIGSAMMAAMIWLRSPNVGGFTASLVFTLLITPYFYNELHNTKATPYFTAAALLAVLFGTLKKQYSWCIIGGIVAVLGSMIRFQAFLMGAALVFGICAVCFFSDILKAKRSEWLKGNLRLFVSFAVLFAVIFALYAFDVIDCSKDADISYYRTYNAARGKVSDYDIPDYEENKAEYESLGISQNDYEVIVTWNFSDPEVFNEEQLGKIAGLRPSVSPADAARNMATDLTEYLKTIYLIPLLIVAEITCIIFADKRGKAGAAWVILAFFGMFFYLCLGGRTTRWVISGLSAAAICCLFFCISVSESVSDRKPAKTAFTVLIVLCVVFNAITLIPEISTWSDVFSTGGVKLRREINTRENTLYIADVSNSLPLQVSTPVFSSAPRDIYKNIYPLGGWDSGSSAKNSILERFGISKDESPFRVLAERADVMLLDSFAPQQKITFIREHFYPNADCALYEVISSQFIYSVTMREFGDIEPTFEITDHSIDYSSDYEGYYYVGTLINREITAEETVYFEITTLSGTVHTYQARSIDSDSGTGSVIIWIPEWDLTEGISGLTVRTIIDDGNRVISSDTVTLF